MQNGRAEVKEIKQELKEDTFPYNVSAYVDYLIEKGPPDALEELKKGPACKYAYLKLLVENQDKEVEIEIEAGKKIKFQLADVPNGLVPSSLPIVAKIQSAADGLLKTQDEKQDTEARRVASRQEVLALMRRHRGVMIDRPRHQPAPTIPTPDPTASATATAVTESAKRRTIARYRFAGGVSGLAAQVKSGSAAVADEKVLARVTSEARDPYQKCIARFNAHKMAREKFVAEQIRQQTLSPEAQSAAAAEQKIVAQISAQQAEKAKNMPKQGTGGKTVEATSKVLEQMLEAYQQGVEEDGEVDRNRNIKLYFYIDKLQTPDKSLGNISNILNGWLRQGIRDSGPANARPSRNQTWNFDGEKFGTGRHVRVYTTYNIDTEQSQLSEHAMYLRNASMLQKDAEVELKHKPSEAGSERKETKDKAADVSVAATSLQVVIENPGQGLSAPGSLGALGKSTTPTAEDAKKDKDKDKPESKKQGRRAYRGV